MDTTCRTGAAQELIASVHLHQQGAAGEGSFGYRILSSQIAASGVGGRVMLLVVRNAGKMNHMSVKVLIAGCSKCGAAKPRIG